MLFDSDSEGHLRPGVSGLHFLDTSAKPFTALRG
jgi:hypothetical protein